MCPPGRFMDKTGAQQCYDCEDNQYTVDYGRTTCLSCPDEGSDCRKDFLSTQHNYWLVRNNESASTYLCPELKSLEGDQCAPNHKPTEVNLLCGECLDGYNVWAGLCVDCNQWSIKYLIFYFVILFGATTLLHYAVQMDAHDLERSKHYHSETLVKILLYYVQIALVVAGAEATNSGVTSLVGILSFNVARAAHGTMCFAPLNPYQNAVFTACLPIFMWLCLLLHATISYYVVLLRNRLRRTGWVRRLRLRYGAAPEMARDMRFVVAPYYTSAVAILIFTLVEVGVTTLNYLQCDQVGDKRIVFSSPSIDCDSKEYFYFLPLIVILLIVLLCIIPLYFCAMVIYYTTSSRDIRNNKDMNDRVGFKLDFFFSTYHSNTYWWEMWVAARRIAYVAIAVSCSQNEGM